MRSLCKAVRAQRTERGGKGERAERGWVGGCMGTGINKYLCYTFYSLHLLYVKNRGETGDTLDAHLFSIALYKERPSILTR